MINQNLMKKNTVSACLIVKNSEKYLADCLKNLFSLADEIILLDTGSNDKTIDLAVNISRKYHYQSLKIYRDHWQNDFSKARNKCIEQATQEWILYLDADEIISDGTQKNLHSFLEKNNFSGDTVLCFRLLNPHPETGEISSYFRYSMFRRNRGIFFYGPVHEFLKSSSGELKVIDCPDFEIYHQGNLISFEEFIKKRHNYIDILVDFIDKNREGTDLEHFYFHLGNMYGQIGQFEKALNEFQNCFFYFEQKKLNKNNSFYGDLLSKMIRISLFHLENSTEVLEKIKILLKLAPEFPDALFYLACYHQKSGKIKDAIAIYEYTQDLLLQKKQLNLLGIISFEEKLAKFVLNNLAECYLLIGDKYKADFYRQKGLS